jgi:hypothetical protein
VSLVAIEVSGCCEKQMVAMEVSDCYGKSMVAMEVYGSVDLF